jgi:hypothetical protein
MRLALLVLLVMDKFVRGEGRATAAGATRADDRIKILQGIAPNTDKDHLHRVLEHVGGNIEAAAEYLLSREAAIGGAGAATAASTSDADEGALSRTACAPSADVFTVAISVYCHRHASGAGDHAWQGEGGLEGLKIRAIRAFIRVEASTRNSGN